MTYNGYKLPKITTDTSDTIRLCDLKAAKERMKELKYDMEDMLMRILDETQHELRIIYNRVFVAEATFYEASTEPVFYIQAHAWDRETHNDIFVEVFASENSPSPSICHKYEKVS